MNPALSRPNRDFSIAYGEFVGTFFFVAPSPHFAAGCGGKAEFDH
jgi:hypothetical protein